VFYEIWHRPLLTINGGHLINDVINLCGGHNVFARLPALTPAVSEEAVLASVPDIVIGGDSATSASDFETRWDRHPVASLRRLPRRYVPADEIQRATPRIIAGARKVCAHLDALRGVARGSGG
jgi:iron complex transport system substrate-binding protein